MKKLSKILLIILSLVFLFNLTACECKHDWSVEQATCFAPKICNKCGIVEQERLNHNWLDATCDKPKTCEYCGTTWGNANGHSVGIGTCSICNKKSTELIVNANDIIKNEDGIIVKITEVGNYLISSYNFSTDKYQRQYVIYAVLSFVEINIEIENGITACGNYNEFSACKTQFEEIKTVYNNFLDKYLDENSAISGSYKDIRTDLSIAISQISTNCQNILIVAKNWF